MVIGTKRCDFRNQKMWLLEPEKKESFNGLTESQLTVINNSGSYNQKKQTRVPQFQTQF